MARLFCIIIFILFISCQNKLDCGIDQAIITTNDSIISKIYSDTIGQKWWNDHLAELKEPSLNTEGIESYRLIIHDNMWSSSKSYRISKNPDSYKLTFKEFGGEQVEFENRKLTIEIEKDISKKKWDEFKSLTKELNFWSMLVNDEKQVLDGTSWILEGRMPNASNCTNRDYHLVGRSSPEDSLRVMSLYSKLVKLYE